MGVTTMQALAEPEPRTGRLPARVVSIAFPDGLLEEVERVRGHESRSAWVARAIRAALKARAVEEGGPR